MANLNPAAYANGGITIPNGLVGMPNNPRAMHLAMTQNPIGFPTMLTANMNNQRLQQMPMGQNPSPPITRNPVSYLSRPSGRSILRVLLFGEYLAGENAVNKKDIAYWKRIVMEFFSEEGRMIYGLWNPEAGGSRSFDIPNPVISRFFQVNFESGVTSIQLTMNSIKENFTTPVSIANNCMAYNSTVEAKASLIYNYEDGSRVVASGRLKVRLNHHLKIDCFEFNTEKHMEYVPRQQQTMLPESPIGPMGIPIKTLRCLELAEGVVTLHDLIEKSISSNKGPLLTLYALANPEQQSQTIINQSNHTPPTPGPSPPEPPAKTPKEKNENLNMEQQHYTDIPAPSPSTSNANIKDSPTSKPSVKSSPVFSKMDTPKQKRRKPQYRKNSRQETGS
ncbi:hypothetical protein RhiirA5_351072 [Rhizophagus irregularis]|uniref:LIM-domain binding protein n=1 Tax=Rhizophagus irregularis TaxID=588596 RepID=A0A2I1DW41_9GLOM|nr:hypothetical protein RhiirA5_351072 [Rhizophagus irregularis]PKY14095.1 hypothetical protein RhiirB3_399828 [Rhizophagus irregularis]CAB4490644.1 unnamed protein product [Rhizophagus irregularis]CAB5215677.1 unnamed protein product [Rhizophagus irregularis]CAB5376413.1 unnamed protein product [Rhizophagus irregularis]